MWSDDEMLIMNRILINNVWIDVLSGTENEEKYNEVLNKINKELDTNAKIYDKPNKKIFINNFDFLMSCVKNSSNFIYRIKYAKILFDYFDSVCGIRMLKKDTIGTEILQMTTKFKNDSNLAEIIFQNNNDSIVAQAFLDSIEKIKKSILDLFFQEYDSEIIEEWSTDTKLNEKNKTKIVNKIKILLTECEMYGGKLTRMKIATVIFQYLNSSLGKIFMAKHENFKNTVMNKISEFSNDKSIAEFIKYEQHIKEVTKFKNILEEVNQYMAGA